MRSLVSILLVAGLLTPQAVRAQSKAGTTILQFLKIEPGARGAAMGNAGAALYSGIDCVYFNPGVAGTLRNVEATFTHSEWFVNINYDYAAVSIPVSDFGTMLMTVTALTSGEMDVRTVDQPLGTGERYTVADVAVGLGYGQQITSRFAAGIQAHYATERIWHSSVRVITFDLGTVYRLSESGLLMGFSLSNLGTRASFDGRDLAILYDANPEIYGDNSALPANQATGSFMVPLLMRLGLSYPRRVGADSKVILAVDALHPNDNAESVNTGVEWSWRNSFALRAGYQTLFDGTSDLGLTLGFGLQTDIGRVRGQLDYGWADHELLGSTHRFTVVLGF
jgi:hypothetical protein